MSKEELIGLLKTNAVKEFNSSRPKDREELLDLTESDLSSVDLTGVDLSYADLSGSDFCEANLHNVNFANSDLSSVNFARANIAGVSFTGADLNGAKFSGAIITRSDFSDSDASGADFCEADLSNTDLSAIENLFMCHFDTYTVWPDIDMLPEDFSPQYEDDLASLKDDEEQMEEGFSY